MIYKTKEEIELLADRLLDLSLPKKEWTHAAHLAAGLCLINRYGLERMLDIMPSIIRNYNEATGTPNTDNDGYHHTLTIFYLNKINHFMKENLKEDNLVALCHKLISGHVGSKKYPFEYYSKELLFSVKARHYWVEPDLQCI